MAGLATAARHEGLARLAMERDGTTGPPGSRNISGPPVMLDDRMTMGALLYNALVVAADCGRHAGSSGLDVGLELLPGAPLRTDQPLRPR